MRSYARHQGTQTANTAITADIIGNDALEANHPDKSEMLSGSDPVSSPHQWPTVYQKAIYRHYCGYYRK